jgi:uncharacterized protein
MFTIPIVIAAILTLIPLFAAAFFTEELADKIESLPPALQLIAPSLLAVPYAIVTISTRTFSPTWFALYFILPIAIAALLRQSRRTKPDGANWQDFLVLAVVGLAVDLRWFESAWPPRLAVFNKMLLLDAGIYGFLFIRRLAGTGFDLRMRLADLGIGMRELAFYLPIALTLGLSLNFLHYHAGAPWLRQLPSAFLFTFFFIAIPEELFFRGWLQNLLERRIGRYPALFATAILFGLSHFNKRAVLFNWRYVLMAAIAGIFYGRAWRQQRRVAASAITHASVDTIWSLFLR